MSHSARDPASAPVLTDTLWFVEVVRDAQAGNLSAFDTLFRYYNARICTYLTRMVGNDEEGHDLAQETFIKVWRALPGMHDESRFEIWLYRIATNTAIDQLRRRKFRWPLRKNHVAEDTSERMRMAGPEEQVEEAELVKLALAQLTPQYRACLLLQHVAGFTQREIAQSLNLSEKSISIYVGRGSEQFRQAYERLENGHDATKKRRLAP
jgi:RNA polymerase sigma-70 factor (ECF subfamily)